VKIDRHQFLILTAAITATTTGGCGPKVTAELPPQPASSTMRASSPPPQAKTTPAPLNPAYDPLGAAPPGPTDEVGGPIAEVGYATAEGGYAIAEISNRPQFAPDPRCAALRAPGPTCESFSSTVELCSAVVRGLDQPLADAVVTCLSQKSSTQRICKWNVVSDCLEQSAAQVRPGGRDTATCVAAAQKCGGAKTFDRRRCTGALSHALPPRRDRFAACIAEFCEIGNCVYELD